MRKALKLFIIVAVLTDGVWGANDSTLTSLFERYLGFAISGKWDSAAACWQAEEITAANRLGTSYRDVPAKYDCASPVITALDGIKNGAVKVSVTGVADSGDYAEITATLVSGDEHLTPCYFASKTGDGWKLGSPLHILTGNWRVVSTKYFNIHIAAAGMINSAIPKKLDSFVERAGKMLGFTAADFDRLAHAKIDYFLCPAEQVERLTGFKTEGMADLPMDAVVTRHPLHEHEIAHLLVNYALKETPLYTLPFIQEGTACCLGGRWEKSPAVVFYAGYMAWNFQLLEIDDLLTYEGFNTTIGSADISYPASALLTAYLMKKLPSAQFHRLYLSLCGTNQFIHSLNADTVKDIISSATGESWDSLVAGFKAYYASFKSAGIVPSENIISEKPTAILSADGVSAKLWQENGLYQVTVEDSGKGEGYILVKLPGQVDSAGYASRLFAEQMPKETYAGEDFGIRYSPSEIAVYDYKTDRLLAIYLPSMSGANAPAPASPRGAAFDIDPAVLDALELSNCQLRLVRLK